MIKIIDQQENYLLVTDGVDFTVIERRAGKFYGLRGGASPWIDARRRSNGGTHS